MLRLSGCYRIRSFHFRFRKFSNLNQVPTKGIDGPKTTSITKNVKETKEPSTKSSSIPYKNAFKVYNEQSPRFNDFNIQMITKSMCDHLFGKDPKNLSRNLQELNKAIMELKKHGLMTNVKETSDKRLKLPKLEGKTIDDHFYNIGEEQCASYRNLVLGFLSELPKVPSTWELKEGWVKYTEEGSCSISFPDEDALVFDVEVCCSEGQMPTIATAVSSNAWYSWVSPKLLYNSKRSEEECYTLDQLIPLESNESEKSYNLSDEMKRPRIVIGHNVSYDRARIKEQYWVERTGLRFLDTLSLHVCISGVTSYQRNLLKAGLGQDDEWSKLSSLNNLSKVHELYCGSEISKEERDIFVKGTHTDVLNNFQTLMSYCANDVIATHNVLCRLFPLYLARFPHPVSLAGMLELGLSYLPINSSWNQYISDCNEVYDDLNHEAKQILSQLADNACQFLHEDAYKKHLWLWDQDWTVKNLVLKKKLPKREKKIEANYKSEKRKTDSCYLDSNELPDYEEQLDRFSDLLGTDQLLPVKPPHLPGYPAWYTKLCPKMSSPEWSHGPQLISTSMQITPKLLSLTWQSVPLHYVRGHGWGMLVPYKTNIEIESVENVPLEELVLYCQNIDSELFCKCQKIIKDENLPIEFNCDKNNFKNGCSTFCRSEMGSGCGLIKLPHKDGKNLNVGNPLARDYIHKFSKNSLGGGDEKTGRLIEISKMLSYWRNNKERVENQIAVWLSKKSIPSFMKTDKELGAILPQVIVSGTLTRRAVEPTWMTASNALTDRVGSELRAMITAPPSYCLVGADVDSQELWIASIIGDAYSYSEHGSTPFGWMTLSGQKSDGTDMHSVTAKAIGISRNHAKVINYARIYGAGQPFAEHLLKQFNPDMSASEAKQKASKMFSMTKGKKVFVLKRNLLPDLQQRTYTRYGAREICLLYGKSIDELFEIPKWIGGTESAMFNRLEEIASDPEPKTPFLKGRLSRALEPGNDTDDKFIPTRVNWVVQSGAVDFLHLMLVCMRWLVGPNIRFCLSFHDEVRYLVPQNLRYQVALALHVTNLYTRAFCISQLGMIDVPQSVAFFSSVEVDTVLRKEADLDCKTPSNPFGLSKGYGINPGESLNIEEAIKKARGIVGLPSFRAKRYCSSLTVVALFLFLRYSEQNLSARYKYFLKCGVILILVNSLTFPQIKHKLRDIQLVSRLVLNILMHDTIVLFLFLHYHTSLPKTERKPIF